MNPEDAAGALGAVGGLLAGGIVVFAIIFLVLAILPIIAYWKIIAKTGNAGPLALLLLIPLVNLIVIYWLAFGDWPALRQGAAGGAPGTYPGQYPPPQQYPQQGYPPPQFQPQPQRFQAPLPYPPPAAPPQMPTPPSVQPRPTAPPPAAAAFCGNCGAKVTPGSQFCTSCGGRTS